MLRGTFIETSRLQRVAALSMLAVVLAVPIFIMRGKSATFDEVSHLPAGYSYWIHHSIEFNLQHPPLIKEICALPLLFMPVELPTGAHENEWAFGKDFLFHQNANRLLFWGRVPAVVLSFGLAILVMRWATSLWGKSAGLLAVFLYAFDPTLTAHAQLVTTDVGLAFFSTLYLWYLRCYLRAASVKHTLLAGLTLGLGLGAKFSAVILIPVSLLLIGIAGFSKHRIRIARTSMNLAHSLGSQPNDKNDHGNDSWMTHAIAFLGILALATMVLWALYFFPKDPSLYWKGIQSVNRDRGENAYFYLMGDLRPGGWKYYFLIAWLVKTPIPTLLLLAGAAGVFLFGKRNLLLDEAFLIVPAISYFAFYSFYADDIGVRYLIPCFPFLFIFASRLGLAVKGAKGVQKVLFGSILFWSFTEYLMIVPDHLSYFNQFAGGSDRGFEWLDHSNVDWGQGLIQLQQFIQERQISDYAYFYFGTADPEYYGIHGRRITNFEFMIRPTKGLVILSAHFLPRGRDALDRVFGSGPLNWLRHQKPIHIVGHCFYVYEIR